MRLILSSYLLFMNVFAQATVEQYFDLIKSNPIELRIFLNDMPKGADLHYHLSGGPYPETMLQIAAKNDYCLDSKTYSISKNSAICRGVSTKNILTQPELYAKVIRSWSMKDFVAGDESSHDHFFNTFLKFTPLVFDHRAELIANVVSKASQQHVHYLELMILADNGQSTRFGTLIKDKHSLSQKRTTLLADKDFQKNIHDTVVEANDIQNKAQYILKCKTNKSDACQVQTNFLYYTLREQPFDNFFAQTVNAFEAVTKSQLSSGPLVGINLVQPEDGIISLRDYKKQMHAYQFLHSLYPRVNIALHAGELTPELVAPDDLSYHIHDAFKKGHAQRIGHGVDIVFEQNAQQLVEQMAQAGVAVELNLISNQRILNVKGKQHPLQYYLAHHVPIVLSTDDEGILRTDLTSQYMEAVLEHQVEYQALKNMSRNGLTYSFIKGKSIWSDAEKGVFVNECKQFDSPQCQLFMSQNPKAFMQKDLELQFDIFEKKYSQKIN